MTTKDLLTVLILALEPVSYSGIGEERTKNEGGLFYRGRPRGSSGYCAAHLLHMKGGTLNFPDAEKGNFDNIYQYAAAEYFAATGTMRERIEVSQEHETLMRAGFNDLSSWVLKQFRVTLYSVPRYSGKQGTAVITVYPQYVVNEEGDIACDLFTTKREAIASDQMRSAMENMSAVIGIDEAKVRLTGTIATSMIAPPSPLRDELDDDSGDAAVA